MFYVKLLTYKLDATGTMGREMETSGHVSVNIFNAMSKWRHFKRYHGMYNFNWIDYIADLMIVRRTCSGHYHEVVCHTNKVLI